MRIGFLGTVYLVVGAIVASTHHYYNHVDTREVGWFGCARDRALAAHLARDQPPHSLKASRLS
jgi:hypothetical protein